MRLQDLFEDYHKSKKGFIHIIKIKNLDGYYLVGNTGQIGDQTCLYLLEGNELRDIKCGKVSAVTEIMRKREGWVTLSEMESCFSEEELQKLASKK